MYAYMHVHIHEIYYVFVCARVRAYLPACMRAFLPVCIKMHILLPLMEIKLSSMIVYLTSKGNFLNSTVTVVGKDVVRR